MSFRMRGSAREQSGQALMLVIGLTTMIFLGAFAIAQNVQQHYPLIEQDVVVHESYRAMQAGVNDYLAMANQNPDTIICNATIKTISNYPNPTSTTSSTPTLPSGSSVCSGFTPNSWLSVPNLSSNKGTPGWYLYGNPVIYVCTGGSSKCPETVWVSLTVVGVAVGGQTTTYTPGTATFQPSNGFLLNLWWLNYDQEDPTTANPSSDCTWYWAPNSSGNPTDNVGSGCVPVDFVAGETLNGNIFSNDPIFICSGTSTSSAPTVNGTISSVNPGVAIEDDPTNAYNSKTNTTGCDDVIAGTYSGNPGQPFEQVPTDDIVLEDEAAQNGCLYEGPTEIQLGLGTGTYASTYGMYVWSPDTQTGGSGTTNDLLDGSSNKSTCMPSSQGGFVPYPKNGVDFVENCASSDPYCSDASLYDPLNPGGVEGTNDVYYPDDKVDTSWEGPMASATSGDAIVEGTESGPLTIAAQNNIVITGNLCYASWTSNGSVACDSSPTSPTTDVLGLIAYNYVVVNHPVSATTGGGYGGGGFGGGQTTYSNYSQCTNNEATYSSSTTSWTLGCDLVNPVIDAAILALNAQYYVDNWDFASSEGNIYVNGAISEDYRGPVGTGSSSTGYDKQYTYDGRLEYLSPPDYLNPGTTSWTLGTISATMGTCPSSLSACKTTP
jgi:hypothetical protein